MVYGILAKNPEAECVDDVSIWTQIKKKDKEKRKKNRMSNAKDDRKKKKKTCVHFGIVLLSLDFSEKQLWQLCYSKIFLVFFKRWSIKF